MKRLFIFVLGAGVGAGSIYCALTHHLLRTSSGWEFLPKASATFDDCYVDVRTFGLSEWAEHRELVAAIINAQKEAILGDAGRQTIENSAGRLLDGLRK